MRVLPSASAVLAGVVLVGTTMLAMPAARAQEGPGGMINPQRDCQTILTCRYAKGGSWRGCVSSYSCRACSFVSSDCSIGASRKKICRRVRCTWGA